MQAQFSAPPVQRQTRPAVRGLMVFLRLLVAMAITFGGLVATAPQAQAADAADISKALDASQDPGGFTAPNSFATGALVRYRITVSCSSLDTSCVTANMTDVLDPNLTFVRVIAPTVSTINGTLPITTATSGQTVTTKIGSTAIPFTGGQTLELVLVARVTGYPATGTILNKATITTASGFTKTTPDVLINVPKPTPNWDVVKGASPGSVAVGEISTFTLQFSTPAILGNVNISGGTLVDTFPTGALIVDAAGATIAQGGSTADGGVVDYVNHTITWTVDPITTALLNVPGGTTTCPAAGCLSVWAKHVAMRFPAPAFTAGQTVTNKVAATVTYADGTTGSMDGTANVSIIAAVTTPRVTKGGPTTVVPGERISWAMRAENQGSVTESNWTITDALPTSSATNFYLAFPSSPNYMPISGVPTQVTFEYRDAAGTWQTMRTWNPGDPAIPNLTIPAGATAIRATAASLAPGSYIFFYIGADPTAPVGSTIQNCATLTGSSITTPSTSCLTTTVINPTSELLVAKGIDNLPDPQLTTVAPGDLFTFYVGVRRISGSQMTSIDVADQLPSVFEFVKTLCINQVPAGLTPDSIKPSQGYALCLESTAVAPTITQNSPTTGTTLLQWLDLPVPTSVANGSQWEVIAYQVRVKPGTSVAFYTNKVAASSAVPGVATTCANAYGNTTITDVNDFNNNQLTNDVMCQNAKAIEVRLAAGAETTKWDLGPLPNASQTTGLPDPNCPNWDGFTRYPCVAVTNPGGAFEYRFNIQNTGNQTLTNYVAYDILPYVGDTGVGELLSTQSRATEWTPVLTGPIQIESQVAAAGTQIMYNLTTNPCRPEAAAGASDANWQATCDNTWYTAAQITDWATVKSFRITAFQSGAVWQPTEQIILRGPMKAPLGAPESTKTPLDLSIAWNSIVHREFKINADGTTARMLAAEPIKVGIIVPFPGVSVGDYVWYDKNRNGLQDAGEAPISGVKVELKNAAGTVVQTTTTNADGYYSFQYLDASTQYTIVFTAPKGMVFTTPNASGITTNDPVKDNGTTALNGTTGGDSDAIPAADGLTGSVTFTTPSTGSNKVSDPTAGTVADNPGLDAGFHPDILPVSIGDFVWLDNNRDGLQTAGEPGVSGVKVVLTDASGAQVGTYTTAADGYYWFSDLVAGAKYTLTFTAPSGYSWTTQNVGGDTSNSTTTDVKDSDVNPADGTIAFTAPSDGTNGTGAPDKTDNPTLDGGLVQYNLTLDKALTTTGLVRVGSTVTFTLTPHNAGPSTANASWSIKDVLPVGLTATAITGSTSHYSCTLATLTCTNDQAFPAGADMGFVTVTATVDAGATGTLTNLAYVAPASGDVVETVPLGTPPTTPVDASTTATDNDGSAVVTLTPYVSVGDFVWYDANRNGVQDAGEAPYAGMTVQLFKGTDTSVAPVKSTTTNAAGYYSFTDLDPSTQYTIKFVKLSDETFTTQNAGGVTSNSPTADLTDSDANLTTGEVTFTTTATGKNLPSTSATSALADNPGIDAGIVRYNLTLGKALVPGGPYYAGSTVTFTLTPHNDGPVAALAGWSVTEVLPADLILDSMSGTGYDCATTKGTCVASAPLAANANGNPITVTVKVGAGFTGSTKNVAYVKPAATDGVETNPLVTPVSTTDTVTSPTDNDAEAAVPVASLVSIGDYVWRDDNRDGLQSAGEPGLDGVLVTLKDAKGATVATVTTHDGGYYWFKDLTPGAGYSLTFTAPSGYTWTTQNVPNGSDALNSDVNPADGTVSFTAPASGSNGTGANLTDNPKLDAGVYQYNLTLTKTTNAPAQVRPGDTVTFTLTPSNAGPSAALANWSVKDVLPAGLTATAITGSTSAYTCTLATLSCVNNLPFAAGADLGFVTVTATVNAFSAGTTLTNLAYVAPTPGDGPETTPLGPIPTTPTDASTTPTDNDGSVVITLVPYVSVGDYVWYDNNRDGAPSAGESPYANMTVQLFQGTDTTGTPVKSTLTNANGYYSFVNLDPSTTYTVRFVKAAGETFTTQNAGGVTTNGATDDLADSDANPATGAVTFVTTATGNNQPSTSSTSVLADNPGIDAGIVKYNLVLEKTLDTKGPYVPGQTVTYTLTPRNEGPATALPGWSVTDVVPAGLTVTSVQGPTSNGIQFAACDLATVTCVYQMPLSPNATGLAMKVTATIDATFTGVAKNVAYVAPAATDGVETNPLVKPTVATDTTTSTTDNDAQASLEVKKVSIGDYVWWDTNRDGQQSEGEKPVPGVTVELWLGKEKVASTTTSSTGYYAFKDLLPGTDYVVRFIAPDGTAFTKALTGATMTDSNANVSDGTAAVTTPATGSNLADAGKADNPTIDAGLVQMNLVLVKTLVPGGPYYPASTVTFTLTPSNNGHTDALAGWSVTEVLPSGLTLVSMTGEGYDCTTTPGTCVASLGLPAGTSGPVITVTATVDTGVSGALTNVAYVAPGKDDPAPESNPLVVPTSSTKTTETPTDNDAEASLTVSVPVLPNTGSAVEPGWLVLAVTALLSGVILVGVGARRRRSPARSQ